VTQEWPILNHAPSGKATAIKAGPRLQVSDNKRSDCPNSGWRGSVMLTSETTRSKSEAARSVRYTVVATALLDRLLHHAIVVRIEGASYRLRRHADLLPDTGSARPMASAEPAPRRRGRPPKLRTGDLTAAT
jgi:IstB-like ATP binding protein